MVRVILGHLNQLKKTVQPNEVFISLNLTVALITLLYNYTIQMSYFQIIWFEQGSY